jgi:RNA polymerase sigma-70 factor, ECF subfamily
VHLRDPRIPAIDPGPTDLKAEVAAVYEKHAAELLAYAVTLGGSEDGAPDAVQETFLRYFIERSYGRDILHTRAWLYRVLRNYVLDRVGSASFRWEVSSGELPETAALHHDPESRLRQSQAARQVAAALTPREMECLRLRADELSYEEIASVLGIRPGTVSALLTRVHKKLRSPGPGRDGGKSDTGRALWLLFQGGESYPA